MIYFDNSATTRPFKEVLETFQKVNQSFFANPSSLHGLGSKVDKLIGQARVQIANLLQVGEEEIYFTSGGTESNNLAIKGTALQFSNRGKHIITTSIEHPSVKQACKQLEAYGFTVTYLPVTREGHVRVEDVQNAITDKTILVSIMHVNNEIGSIQPIQQIGELLKTYDKIVFHVDAVQSIGKVNLNLMNWGIDLCTLSSHKFHGLKGTGILYKRKKLMLSPIISGGEQENYLRSGTENTGGIVSTAKALRMHMEMVQTNLHSLYAISNYLKKELSKHEEIINHSPSENGAPHILNFSLRGIKGEVLVHAFEEYDIYISTTSACSSKQKAPSETLLQMGKTSSLAESAVRISLSYENTMEEAERFSKVLTNVIAQFRTVIRRQG
ncbi:cysteine desulfurase family protein [Bacillus coahuilensis]|uniref:cysteine desulfurase family protein n=1 Tax=Bacillus coahuilensis TaxID=408580 RepID=UPI0001850866|nr:cysteine desulfurase family protein [Bacillus coahuilensis]